MIKTLYDIGRALEQSDKYQVYFELWENPFKKGKILVADFGKNLEYLGKLTIGEDKKERNLKRYLYKSFHKGANIVPSFIVTKTKSKYDGGKAFDKLVKCIENYHSHHFGFSRLPKKKLKQEIIKRYQPLKEDLVDFSFNERDSYLFTIRIEGEWIGEIPYFLRFFEEHSLRNFHTKNYSGIVTSKHENQLCSLTNIYTEVYGFVDTLGFTVDSHSFMRSGFDQADSYKMLPVSAEAVKLLEGSKKVILNELTRKFYNLRYFILPHFVSEPKREVMRKLLNSFIKATKDGSFETTGESIINNEKILRAIAEREELQLGVYYDILFYQQQQAQFLIKLHLNDVLPSQIKRIFETKKRIEKYYHPITKRVYTDKKTKLSKTKDFHITFAYIKNFFSKKVKKRKKEDYIYQPYFFKVLEAVFHGSLLLEQQIINSFIKQIRTDFKQQNKEGKSNTYIRRTKDSFVLYQYFLHLSLFKNKTPMEEKEKQPLQLTTESFIKQHPAFFDSEYKKGVFRLGSLSAYLMSKQYKKLKSTPFIKQLNSLNIDERTITKILPKLINKLREYETAVPDLEQKIAQALVQPNKLNKDEISYTFTLGLVMQKEFAKAYKARKSSSPSDEEE